MPALEQQYPDVPIATLKAIENSVRTQIVSDLRGSAFLYCDVSKEDVLLCIKHGTVVAVARKLEAAELENANGCMRCNTPSKCAVHGCSPLTWPAEDRVPSPTTNAPEFTDGFN